MDRSKKELKEEAQVLKERNKKLQRALEIALRKNKKMVQKNDKLKLEKQSMEEQVEEVNDFGPSIFDVPMDFMNAIVTWMDEYPEEVAKRRAKEKRKCRVERAKDVEEIEKKNDEEKP